MFALAFLHSSIKRRHAPGQLVDAASCHHPIPRQSSLVLYLVSVKDINTAITRLIVHAQLERIAVNVSRSAMPSSSDNSELANRLAMQAAALEADNMDPLGLGRIDTQVLGLVSVCALEVRTCT